MYLLQETDSHEINVNDTTPPTAKSSNKTKSRISLEVENCDQGKNKMPKFKNVKVEKVSSISSVPALFKCNNVSNYFVMVSDLTWKDNSWQQTFAVHVHHQYNSASEIQFLIFCYEFIIICND